MGCEEYTAFLKAAKKWDVRKNRAIKRIKRENANKPINIICEMVNAVRRAPIGEREFYIKIKDVEGKNIKVFIKI